MGCVASSELQKRKIVKALTDSRISEKVMGVDQSFLFISGCRYEKFFFMGI